MGNSVNSAMARVRSMPRRGGRRETTVRQRRAPATPTIIRSMIHGLCLPNAALRPRWHGRVLATSRPTNERVGRRRRATRGSGGPAARPCRGAAIPTAARMPPPTIVLSDTVASVSVMAPPPRCTAWVFVVGLSLLFGGVMASLPAAVRGAA